MLDLKSIEYLQYLIGKVIVCNYSLIGSLIVKSEKVRKNQIL